MGLCVAREPSRWTPFHTAMGTYGRVAPVLGVLGQHPFCTRSRQADAWHPFSHPFSAPVLGGHPFSAPAQARFTRSRVENAAIRGRVSEDCSDDLRRLAPPELRSAEGPVWAQDEIRLPARLEHPDAELRLSLRAR